MSAWSRDVHIRPARAGFVVLAVALAGAIAVAVVRAPAPARPLFIPHATHDEVARCLSLDAEMAKHRGPERIQTDRIQFCSIPSDEWGALERERHACLDRGIPTDPTDRAMIYTFERLQWRR